MKTCTECHHAIGFGSIQCTCKCHDLANDAPELLGILTKITAEAMGGEVMDVTARKAIALIAKHNNHIVDRLL